MSALSLREIAAHATLTYAEAVAVAQALIATSKHAFASGGAETPTLDTIQIAADGSIAYDAPVSAPDAAGIGSLLNTLLPADQGTRVPGALRYAIARATNEVDAPPFDSLDALASALARHERGERAVVLQQVYARAAAAAPAAPGEQPARMERRQHGGEHAAALRRELRRADEALYLLEQRAAIREPILDVPSGAMARFAEIEMPFPDLPMHDDVPVVDVPGFRARTWLVGGMLAVVLAFAAGYAAVPLARRANANHPPPTPAHEAARPDSARTSPPSL